MYGEEVAIVAIVFGSVLAIVFMGILSSIINNWIKRGSGKNITENKEFLAALRDFKEKTDRRLSNLEAIVSEDTPSGLKKAEKAGKKTEQKSSIEIEIENVRKEDSGQEGGKLRNMLNQ